MPRGIYGIKEVFHGLDASEALEKVFGSNDQLKEVLAKTKIRVAESRGYMRVNDEDGSVIISRAYLKTGSSISIYLDIIHELTHVKQHLEGKELYDPNYRYVDRPTEIEAYQVVIEEARRLGMSNEEIKEYLKVGWINKEEHEMLARRLGIKD